MRPPPCNVDKVAGDSGRRSWKSPHHEVSFCDARQRTEASEEELKNVGEFYKALDRLGYDPNL